MGSVWDSMKTIVGLKAGNRSNIELKGYKSDRQLAQDFNEFSMRFDVHDFSDKHFELKSSLLSTPPFNPSFGECSVIKCFKGCKPRKSPGPDNIGSRLLSVCAEQLGPIFNYIFQRSLTQQRVPSLWKRSIVVPVF